MRAEEFGLFIRSLRKEKQMTIRQLELYSGVSHSYLSQLENGKKDIPSANVINKISKALKLPQELLMQKAGYIERDQLVDLKQNKFQDLTDDEIRYLEEQLELFRRLKGKK
ncbi:transcriptional regulator with XRE-family HTH domain [Alkalihalobacillus xiaoxiensis]|uniref:Transcriptional regulator with XRE-family HTH domain n=1 Tax=Shouchella xiaoxiensis TaxID=766895 RepID=A0ABS2SYN5_9BACI|nr:helix-turn-helix transcriptional regulator [Shouchella xiaoxiensis]MBM7840647.1 transcriptional regulator with XRE-family HTH domain [Shouchella xiaoxiensis]